MSESKQETSVSSPPYVSWKTFWNFLERLQQGVPSHIDRTMLNGYSGAVMSQLLVALRFLGLIGNNGETTDRLRALVEAQGEDRKALIGDMIRESYPFLSNGFDLSTATTGTLDQQLRELNVSGDTLRKCSSFIVFAAKEAGLPVSAFIKTGHRAPAKANPKRSGRKPISVVAHSVTLKPPGDQVIPEVHPAILGYFQGLPKNGVTWTQPELDQWLEGMRFTLAMVYQIKLTPKGSAQ